jgi:hypothetical protein
MLLLLSIIITIIINFFNSKIKTIDQTQNNHLDITSNILMTPLPKKSIFSDFKPNV